MVEFPPFWTREITSVNSCLLSVHQAPFEKKKKKKKRRTLRERFGPSGGGFGEGQRLSF